MPANAVFEFFLVKAINRAAEEAGQRVQSFDPLRFSRKYKRVALQRHSEVKILGMAKPVSISSIFVDIIAYQDIPSRMYLDERILEEYIQKYDDRYFTEFRLRRTPAMEYVKQAKKALVLGKPGSGKTTFLRYLLVRLLEDNPPFKALPIYVSLKEYSDTKQPSLMSFIKDDLNRYCDFPASVAEPYIGRLLHNGEVALLLDGLDEVEVARRSKIVAEINNLTAKYNEGRIFISCRTADYGGWFSGVEEVELADFTVEQSLYFIKRWFRGAPKRAELLTRAVSESNNIRELCTTPLLVALLCILFQYNLKLPEDRAELYSECIDALLYKWDASRLIARPSAFSRLSTPRKKSILAELAHDFMEQQKVVFSTKVLLKNLRQLLIPYDINEVESVLNEVASHHGLLLEKSAGIWSFMHLTIQEYLTALHIVQNRSEVEYLEAHFNDPRWREVSLMIASLLPRADDFIRAQCSVLLKSKEYQKCSKYFRRLSTLTSLGLKEAKETVEKDGQLLKDIDPELGVMVNKIHNIKTVRDLKPFFGLQELLPSDLAERSTKVWTNRPVPFSPAEVTSLVREFEQPVLDEFWRTVGSLVSRFEVIRESLGSNVVVGQAAREGCLRELFEQVVLDLQSRSLPEYLSKIRARA